MGNAESQPHVVSGLNNSQDQPLYKLVDQLGGGELLPWTKHGIRTGDFSILDGYIEVKVSKFVINDGKGKAVPVAELVKKRNDERNRMLSAFRKKKGKGKSGPNILDDFNQEEIHGGDMMKALKLLDGGGKGGKGGSKYREICWDIEKRGGMGETLLHVCLLQGTTAHNTLAKRLLQNFPKLANDIFISDDYYGNSPLHQAIVNEDPEMVRYLLSIGANYHERVYGAFFTPDDQRSGRSDSMEHEWVDLPSRTTYVGRTYWGEYPLSFAACTQQEDCFRLLRAYKADPNNKDTNGNTVLHLMKMFDLAYKLGAKLHVINKQNLTPLTIAAKLAKAQMFQHVLTIERQIVWEYGDVVCAAYPLNYIDTINQDNGQLNDNSALAHIVYGDTSDHLNLFDGLMDDLLKEKWNAFGRSALIRKFIQFLMYWIVVFVAFYLRHFEAHPSHDEAPKGNSTAMFNFEDKSCHLLNMKGCKADDTFCNNSAMIRMTCEVLSLIGMTVQVVQQLTLINRIGWHSYQRTLKTFPALLLFTLSFPLVLLIIPVRLMCWDYVEHVLATATVLAATIHFLFYCRGIKFIGPFVLMIYKIILGDFLRFFTIYVIFVMAFYIIFKSCHRGRTPAEYREEQKSPDAIIFSPFEAVLRMFIMSIGEFAVFYKAMNKCRLAPIGKVLFIVFELLVSIMLINLLIAMMARTYETIAATALEWKRQWAKVILLLEQSLSPKERMFALLKYSRPLGTDQKVRAFVVKWRRTEEEQNAKQSMRNKKLDEYREERRALLKRKLQGELSNQQSRAPSRGSIRMEPPAYDNPGIIISDE